MKTKVSVLFFLVFGLAVWGRSGRLETFTEGFFADGRPEGGGLSVWSEGFNNRPMAYRATRPGKAFCALSTAEDPYQNTAEIQEIIRACKPGTVSRSRVHRSIKYSPGKYKIKAYTQICCIRARSRRGRNF